MQNRKYKAGDFSYNTGKLRCPVCDGTGQISLDVQFLPDVDVPCPECSGSRYGKEAWQICYENKQGREIFASAADGDGCEHGTFGNVGSKAGASAVTGIKGAGAWVSHIG